MPERRRPTPLALAALALLAALPYLGALGSPLLHDDRTLLDNRWLTTEANPVSVFAHDYWFGTKHEQSDLYRPLTVLSLGWNMRATPSRQGIRAVNVALHAAATLAVFWLLVTITSRSTAWIGAALFAAHPLGSEAVLWAVGRAEILAAICGIAAFVWFLEKRRALSLLAFAAALCFKESAVAWLVIGAAWMALRPPEQRPTPKGMFAAAWPYLAVLAGFLILRGSAVGWARHDVPFVDNPLVQADPVTRGANGVLLFARYVGKMFWPRTLSIEYGFDQIPVVPLVPWGAIAALAVVAAIVAGTVVLVRRGRREAAFLVAFVPCAFAVTANLIFPIGTIFAERLAYTPLIGFCGLVGLAFAAIPNRSFRVVATSALVVAGSARAYFRGQDYRDLATLSRATADASPSAVKALYNDARSRLRAGHGDQAIPLLERAVTIWPDYARAKELLDQARVGQAAPQAGEDETR